MSWHNDLRGQVGAISFADKCRIHGVDLRNQPRECGFLFPYPQPLVSPQVSHLAQAPLRTRVKLKHREHGSPSYPFCRASRMRCSFAEMVAVAVLVARPAGATVVCREIVGE